MEARAQHGTTPTSCTTSSLALERLRKSGENAATILKPLVPIQPHFHMVQHLADSCTHHPFRPPLKFLLNTSSHPTYVQELGTIIITRF